MPKRKACRTSDFEFHFLIKSAVFVVGLVIGFGAGGLVMVGWAKEQARIAKFERDHDGD